MCFSIRKEEFNYFVKLLTLSMIPLYKRHIRNIMLGVARKITNMEGVLKYSR